MTPSTLIQVSSKRASQRAFTLIELLGVLMVMALLSFALAPLLVKEMDRLARQQEATALLTLATGLEKHISRNGQIPDQTGWAAAVAAVIGQPNATVTLNGRDNPRVFLIDPLFGVGTNASVKPPFTQTQYGSALPVSPRLLIVSSLATALPSSLVSGVASSTNAFNELWNLADKAVPASWTWGGTGEDLLVQRVHLQALFFPVVLNDFSLQPGRFSVNDSTNTVLPTKPFTTYLLAGSVLGLHGSDGTVQAREVVTRPMSFAHEAGVWRGRLLLGMAGHQLSGVDLQSAMDLFLSAPGNPNAKPTSNPTTPVIVHAAMQTYLSNYLAWAAAGHPASGSIKNAASASQSDLASKTVDLIFKP
jgi:type II secretory pathway pseudopilin PulG